MIPKQQVQQIKDSSDLVEIISDYVEPRKAGSSWKGLSPFTNEKTPSFYVVPSKGFFKDFSSGKAGDVTTFLREVVNMSYPEALECLAQRAGIESRPVPSATLRLAAAQ